MIKKISKFVILSLILVFSWSALENSATARGIEPYSTNIPGEWVARFVEDFRTYGAIKTFSELDQFSVKRWGHPIFSKVLIEMKNQDINKIYNVNFTNYSDIMMLYNLYFQLFDNRTVYIRIEFHKPQMKWYLASIEYSTEPGEFYSPIATPVGSK